MKSRPNASLSSLFACCLSVCLALSALMVSPALAEGSHSLSAKEKAGATQAPADGKNGLKKGGSEMSESADKADALKVDSHSPYKDEAVQHYNRGHDLHQGGFFNQAIAEYKAALAADDRMEEAYTNLGLIYAAQRNYTKAMESFKKALALKPTRPNALNGLGTVLYAKSRFKEAMEKWKQAVEIDPQFASAYYNMGNALETEKDLHGAIDAYVRAMSINPLMADTYYRVGSIFAKQKHVAQAVILLSKAVELDPTAEFVHDAKKTLTSFEGDLKGEESDEPEVKMNIIAPPPDGGESQPRSGGSGAPLHNGASQGGTSFALPSETKTAVERDKW